MSQNLRQYSAQLVFGIFFPDNLKQYFIILLIFILWHQIVDHHEISINIGLKLLNMQIQKTSSILILSSLIFSFNVWYLDRCSIIFLQLVYDMSSRYTIAAYLLAVFWKIYFVFSHATSFWPTNLFWQSEFHTEYASHKYVLYIFYPLNYFWFGPRFYQSAFLDNERWCNLAHLLLFK